MNKTKQTLTSILLAGSLAISANPVQAQENKSDINISENQFFKCKVQADKIKLSEFLYKSEEKKSEPTYNEYERLVGLVEDLNEQINPLVKKLNSYPNPVPSSDWDEYERKFDRYKSLEAKRNVLSEQADFHWNEYETKFKPAYDKAKTMYNQAWESYEKRGCDGSLTASNKVIKKFCPIDTKNIFCTGWDLKQVYKDN